MGSRRGLSPITKQFSAYLAFAIVNLDPKKVPIKLIRRKKVEVNFFYERGERRDLGLGSWLVSRSLRPPPIFSSWRGHSSPARSDKLAARVI